jgi:hypothetical protein
MCVCVCVCVCGNVSKNFSDWMKISGSACKMGDDLIQILIYISEIGTDLITVPQLFIFCFHIVLLQVFNHYFPPCYDWNCTFI